MRNWTSLSGREAAAWFPGVLFLVVSGCGEGDKSKSCAADECAVFAGAAGAASGSGGEDTASAGGSRGLGGTANGGGRGGADFGGGDAGGGDSAGGTGTGGVVTAGAGNLGGATVGGRSNRGGGANQGGTHTGGASSGGAQSQGGAVAGGAGGRASGEGGRMSEGGAPAGGAAGSGGGVGGGTTSNGGAAGAVGGTTSNGGAAGAGGGAVGGTTSNGGAAGAGGGAVGGTTSNGGAAGAGGGVVGGAVGTGGTGTGGADQCPTDPSKTEPGVCGCGVSDVDRDADDVPDCNDICPDNELVTEPGTVTFQVAFTAAAQAYPEYLDRLETCITYAGREWVKHFPVPHDVSIDVTVDIQDIPTASGGSDSSVYAENGGGLDIYHMNVPYQLRTGTDPNGDSSDATVTFGIGVITGTDWGYYWFDPDPSTRTATIPAEAADGLGICLHEMGHVLGIVGWRDWTTGSLPANYASYWDVMTTTDGSDFFFTGEAATADYGANVPETYTNIMHVGNFAPRPGADLGTNLMRGTETLLAHRYYIDALDLAIMKDLGLPLPGTAALEDACDAIGTLRKPAPIVEGPIPPQVE